MTKQIQFTLEKSTKNTMKYTETPVAGQAPVIGVLYVQKWFAGNATSMTVTLDVPDALVIPASAIQQFA